MNYNWQFFKNTMLSILAISTGSLIGILIVI